MKGIKKVDGHADFPQIENRITEFWKKKHIFEKSISSRPVDNLYKFVDGPPFVTGIPHYGTLLPSIAKDVIPRYWTMKGKRVRRVFGWDCHGLPIEEKVSKKLNIRSRRDIEETIGVDAYIDACREYIKTSTSEWRWYIEKIGRWVDMDTAYYTMNTDYMESVIWAFKKIYEKGLIYKGKRVSLYSTDTATPVSQFEVAMDADNYKDVEDLSIFVKFQLRDISFLADYMKDQKCPVYLVAWTTTPWTIPANFSLAVNAEAQYALVMYEGECLIVAEDRISYTFPVSENEIGKSQDKVVRIIGSVSGSRFEGVSYIPVYNTYTLLATKNDYIVHTSEDVVLNEGTGVLHIAPAFGEVDFQFGLKHGISAHRDIDDEGHMTVAPWEGMYLRDASGLITEDLQLKGNLLRAMVYTHRLPFYRGENPLIYMAQDAYFINIQKIKPQMLKLNETINWIPSHIRQGRFAHTISTSPDWCISRNRYWATIMPVWINDENEEIVPGSIKEIAAYTKQLELKDDGYYFEGKPFDLHKDVCDKIVLEKNGKKYYRVPEVLDCWMDSGSVPFAEYHYPFHNTEAFEQGKSADYIIEYIGQVRAWFNVLLRLSAIIFEETPFKNVICTGVIAGNDGRKMSKSYGNYPDPKEVLEHTGAEALRLYMMGSAVMVGEDMNWSDEVLKEQVKNVLLPIWNTYKYICLYASLYAWMPADSEFHSDYILDVWLREYMQDITNRYAAFIEAYNIPASVKLIQECIDNISSWYIRRSRERFAHNDMNALQTLYAAMVQFIKVFAPQMPFLTEELYQHLVVEPGLPGKRESVHLEDYPVSAAVNTDLLSEMERVRKISSLGQSIRVTHGIKLRQPLKKVFIPIEDEACRQIIQEELGVKEAIYAVTPPDEIGYITQTDISENEQERNFVTMDITIDEELREEGRIRDIIRFIQNMRKSMNLEVGQIIRIQYVTKQPELHSWIDLNSNKIMAAVNASLMEYIGDLTGTEMKLEDGTIVLKVL